jgi:hypothetical protein
MAKEPIKWNQSGVAKVTEGVAAGALMGSMPGWVDPGMAVAGAGVGALVGGVAGVAAAYRAKKHRALGRQFKD